MSDLSELQLEQAYLDHAYQRVAELRAAARATMDDVLDLGKGGTFQSRTERDVVVRSSLARIEQLDVGNQPLSFGRIDEIEGDRFYIGRMGISGRDQEPLVVDWRAPVAEPFYRATGRFPMGIARRRHFQFEGRQLVGLEDEPLVMSDDNDGVVLAGKGALLATLERSRSGRMGDIVATIQGEQDEVIRSALAGILIVQGGPGTGKTAVALHRAAYLLYTHRFPLERQGVLVVGPNPVFLRYIGHVLPSLGESGVTLSTVSRLVSDVPVRAEEAADVAAIKGDSRMVRFVARAVRARQRPLSKDVEIAFGPYLLVLSAVVTNDIVAAVRRRGGSHNARRKHLERLVTEHLHGVYLAAVERVRAYSPSVTELDLARFKDSLRDEALFKEILDRMWPRLLPTELIHDLFGAKPLIALAGKDLLSKHELALLHRPRSTSLDDIGWTDADVALIDEARVLLGPAKPLEENEQLTPTFGHIVVDEAQDLSPMQLRMLARRSLNGSMTMVGDIAQASGPWAPTQWQDVLAYLPKSWHPRHVELTIGYRTPAEVMEVAAGVLRSTGLNLTPPQPVRRSGEPPVWAPVAEDQLAKEVATLVLAELAQLDGGTLAVVCPNAALEPVSHALDEAGIEYGSPANRALESAVTVLPAAAAKGLEFDSVVVVEPDDIVEESPLGLRLLYVALTRTTRRLSIVHTKELQALANSAAS